MAKKLTRRQKTQITRQTNISEDFYNINNPREKKFFENKIIFPRNQHQEDALDSLRKNTLTILTGAPGTAKSMLSVYVACELLENREIDKIYYVKPIVDIPGNVGLGFLPGDVKEKILPHIAPVRDSLEVFMSKSKADYLISKEIIEFLPIEHLRGRSLNNCMVIADEVQNTTTHTIFTILTRIGSNSKIALLGDIIQRDLSSSFGQDGLSDVIKRLKRNPDVGHVNFDFEDICRSGFVKSVIYSYADLYE